MSSQHQKPTGAAESRTPGPQGTQLFSADELRRYASETAPAVESRVSRRAPVLKGISAGVSGLRFTLHSGRQAIGRSADNDIVIDDPSVSASHAWIIGQRREYAVMNTLSTNGTFVNDQRVHEVLLKHGDRVRLGQAELVFLTHERAGGATATRLYWLAAAALVVIGLAVLVWWLA